MSAIISIQTQIKASCNSCSLCLELMHVLAVYTCTGSMNKKADPKCSHASVQRQNCFWSPADNAPHTNTKSAIKFLFQAGSLRNQLRVQLLSAFCAVFSLLPSIFVHRPLRNSCLDWTADIQFKYLKQPTNKMQLSPVHIFNHRPCNLQRSSDASLPQSQILSANYKFYKVCL